MDASPWYVEHKSILRLVFLTILIISLLGPWFFDLVYVPGEYPCEWPVVRLYGDFCGMSMSWFSAFLLFAGDFFHILRALLTGTFTGRARELLGLVFLILPVFPLFSSLLLLKKKDTSRLRGFHLIAWGVGVIFPLFILLGQRNVQAILLWGPWLYILMAVSAVTLEFLVTRNNPNKN